MELSNAVQSRNAVYVWDPIRYAVFVGLLLLLSPLFCVSMLLYVILLLPLLLALFIYANAGPEELDILTLPAVLQSMVDDLAEVAGLASATDASTGDSDIISRSSSSAWLPRMRPIYPRRTSFISDFDGSNDSRPHSCLQKVDFASPSSEGTLDQLKQTDGSTDTEAVILEVTPNTPLNKPFDLTDVKFSPHWSVGKGANWSHTPSPLDLSSMAPSPPIYPSPATHDSGVVTPGFNGDAGLSPIRLPCHTQRRNIRSKSFFYPVPQPSLSGFSMRLPDALRNVEADVGVRSAPASVVSTIESSPGFENDDSLLSITGVAIKDIPEDKRRVLLTKYRKVISELEHSFAFEEIPLDDRDDSFITQTPPSLRPATFPRFRGDNSIYVPISSAAENIPEIPSWEEKNKQTAESEGSIKKNHDTGDTGIVVIENGHTVNYHWEDFDQEFDVTVKSPDHLNTEDACTEIWMSKWSQKGVQVMMPVDEESSESNGGVSANISPVSSRKAVHWVDEQNQGSPLAGVIPNRSQPSKAQEPSIIQGLSQNMVQEQTKVLENVLKETISSDQSLNRISTILHTKTQVGNSPSRTPTSTPPRTVSRELIRLFEEMSKAQDKSSAPQALLSLPKDNVAGTMDSMITNSALQMDGATDGTSDERTDQVFPPTHEEEDAYVDVYL